MADNDFLPLDPLLNNELRLIDKLEKAKYIKVKKGYKGKVPQTVCRITPQGIQALADHVQALKSYLNLNI